MRETKPIAAFMVDMGHVGYVSIVKDFQIIKPWIHVAYYKILAYQQRLFTGVLTFASNGREWKKSDVETPKLPSKRSSRVKQSVVQGQRVYCCNEVYDDSLSYIQCSSLHNCKSFEWFHVRKDKCARLSEDEADAYATQKRAWFCATCTDDRGAQNCELYGICPVIMPGLASSSDDIEEIPHHQQGQFWSQAYRKKIRDNDKIFPRDAKYATWDNFEHVKAYFTEHPHEEATWAPIFIDIVYKFVCDVNRRLAMRDDILFLEACSLLDCRPAQRAKNKALMIPYLNVLLARVKPYGRDTAALIKQAFRCLFALGSEDLPDAGLSSLDHFSYFRKRPAQYPLVQPGCRYAHRLLVKLLANPMMENLFSSWHQARGLHTLSRSTANTEVDVLNIECNDQCRPCLGSTVGSHRTRLERCRH